MEFFKFSTNFSPSKLTSDDVFWTSSSKYIDIAEQNYKFWPKNHRKINKSTIVGHPKSIYFVILWSESKFRTDLYAEIRFLGQNTNCSPEKKKVEKKNRLTTSFFFRQNLYIFYILHFDLL